MQIPLHLRSWDLEDFVVVRSGLRWLCPDGHMCQPGETIAYCNIGFRPRRSTQVKPMPFKAEFRDLQIAISSPLSGVLRQNADISKGGFFDLHEGTFVWKDGFTIGNIEASAPGNYQNCAASCGLIMLAGRRMTEIAEIRSGLLTGWHDRSRAWTLSRPGKMGTLLSLGICEMDGVIRGEKSAFLEILGEAGVPMQVVFVPDTPLVPNSRVLAGQLSRTKPEFETISRSLSGALATSDPLVRQLGSCPIADEYELLTAGALHETLNIAALWRLPLVLVCNNNQMSISTRRSDALAAARLSDLAAPFGVPRLTVDGMDVLAVRTAVAEFVAVARGGGGPAFLECLSERFSPHSTSTRETRSAAELAAIRKRCPIARLAAGLGDETLQELEADVDAEVTAAMDFADKSPFPNLSEALADVW